MITTRTDRESNNGLHESIMTSLSSDGHETDTADPSSSSSSSSSSSERSSKAKDEKDETSVHSIKEIPKTTLVVGTPSTHRRRSSLGQILCCVKDATSDERPFPAAYTSCVTSWTEKTRLSFELNIKSLLSTCDSRGKQDVECDGVDEIVWSEAYEERYKNMVRDGITNLKKVAEKDEEQASIDDKIEPADVVTALTALRRGFSPRARRVRLRTLRRKMTPDGASKKVDHGLCKKTLSFDDHVLQQHNRSNSGSHRDLRRLASSNEKKKRSSTTLTRVFEGACACGGDRFMPIDEVTNFGDRSLLSDDDDLAYDSDPEFCQSRKTFTDSFSLAKSLSKEDDTTASVSDDEENIPEELSSAETDPSQNLFNEEKTSKLIDEIIHRSITLVWHPPKSCDKSIKSDAPTCVKAWIELGCRVKGEIIQPKLVWRNAYQQREDSRKRSGVPTPSPLGSIDVLDISRVLSSGDIDRNEFPLAKKSKSFRIITSDQKVYLFEVADGEEKERIILSLKLLVARLASLIIVGDQSLFDDFFYPSSSSDFQRKYYIEE